MIATWSLSRVEGLRYSRSLLVLFNGLASRLISRLEYSFVMGAKDTYYLCTQCGNDFVKWSDDALFSGILLLSIKTIVAQKSTCDHRAVTPHILKESSPQLEQRISTGSSEFDRALRGLVSGSITLLGRNRESVKHTYGTSCSFRIRITYIGE